jgi:hypothetical protein
MSILSRLQGHDLESMICSVGFGAGGGFGDGFSVNNHGLIPDQKIGQNQNYRVPFKNDCYDVNINECTVFQPDPIGTVTDFQALSVGNIKIGDYDGLQERVDFSGHNGSQPHLNYDIYGANARFSRESLGDAHARNLYNNALNENYNLMKEDPNWFSNLMENRPKY